MSWLVRSPVTLLLVAGVLLVSTRMLVRRGDLVRRVARDDWRGVRDEATAVVTGARRAHPALVDQAALLLTIAELVLGDLPAARAAADVAGRRSPAPALRAALHRQRASIERTGGDRAAALALLAEPAASSSGDEGWEVAAQLALVHLDQLDGPTAVAAVRPAVAHIDAQLRGALTSAQRDGYEADLAQLQCTLVRGLLLSGATEEAGAVWASRAQPAHKPYVNGQLCETAAHLAAARHDTAAARQQAEAAVGWYHRVGAAIDEARARALLAACAGDRPALDAAEAALRGLGALGHLDEVAAARRALDARG